MSLAGLTVISCWGIASASAEDSVARTRLTVVGPVVRCGRPSLTSFAFSALAVCFFPACLRFGVQGAVVGAALVVDLDLPVALLDR
jgi:hypothetical protein